MHALNKTKITTKENKLRPSKDLQIQLAWQKGIHNSKSYTVDKRIRT